MSVYCIDIPVTVLGRRALKLLIAVFIFLYSFLALNPFLKADDNVEQSFHELSQDLKTITRVGSPFDALIGGYSTYDALTYALVNPTHQEGALRLLGELERNSESINRLIVVLVQALEERPDLRERIEKNLKRLQEHASFRNISLPSLGVRSSTSALYIMSLVSVVYGFQAAFLDPSVAWSYTGVSDVAGRFFLLHFALNLYAEWRNAKVGIPAYLEQLRIRWRAKRNIQLISSVISKIASLDTHTLKVAREFRTQYFDSTQPRFKRMVQLGEMISQDLHASINENFHSSIRAGFFNNNQEFKEIVSKLSRSLTEHEKLEIQNVMNSHSSYPLSITTRSKLLDYESKVFEILAKEGFFKDQNLARALTLELAEAESQLVDAKIKATKPISIVRFNNALLAASASIIGLVTAVGPGPNLIDQSIGLSAIEFVRTHSASLIQFAGILTIPSIATFWWYIGKNISERRNSQKSLTLNSLRKLRQTVEYAFTNQYSQVGLNIDTKVDLLLVQSLSEKLVDITIREFRFEYLEHSLDRADDIRTQAHGQCGYLITN